MSRQATIIPAGTDQTPLHKLVTADVYRALGSGPQGLTGEEARARLERYGRNAIQTVRQTPLILKFAANFTHLMALLLWLGGAIAFVAQLPQLGIAIWLVNLINGLFSFWQEYRAEQATEALRRLLPVYARVVRDGEEQRVLAEELVPGDLLLLAEGDAISADARLVEENELRVDQSTLSGESHPVRKTCDPQLRDGLAHVELPNLLFAGTSVAAGTGRAVVFATGMDTEFGKIARLTQSLGNAPSPLQKEMAGVTRTVSTIAVSVGLLFFVLAIMTGGMNLAEGFIFGLGMIVAFVPEGLLPTVTLALAMGVQRMARRHALIKRLSAVETLGSTSVICTDKTGTLTQNEMTVRALWLAERELTVTGVGYTPEGELLQDGVPAAGPADSALRRLLLAAALCNNARLLPPNGESPRWTALGDPTEVALRVVALKAGLDLEAAAREQPRLRELPFDSRRKRMTTLHRAEEPGVIAYVKGAPREILDLCTHFSDNEKAAPLDATVRARIIEANDGYARAGLRVLAVAERPLPHLAGAASLSHCRPEETEQELIFLGLVAMMDPPRPEVAEAVETCHRAGIRLVMMTGDYGLTAETIARRLGMISSEQPRLVSGAELDGLDEAGLRDALSGEVIFARVAPEHKLRVVTALQELGHVVAVTGDGVNDAPALKKADIGVAMGLAGTDVAREAADMILTDDNFASIVNAIEEGRAVYANIKKFITYIFTSNTPEAVPFILFAFSGARIPLALTVMQILAIDLGTDMIPALALGAERPEPGLMDRPPRDRREHLITPALLRRAYLWLGPVQALAAMAAFYFYYWTQGYRGQWLDLPASGTIYYAATAMALAAVVTTQIGNLLAQRTERTSVLRAGLSGNPLIWVGIASELVVVALVIYVPLFQWLFGTAPFALEYWWFLFAWAPALLVMDEIRKALVRRREKQGLLPRLTPAPAGR
jgi:P-type Ca2+ transporter type 2C